MTASKMIKTAFLGLATASLVACPGPKTGDESTLPDTQNGGETTDGTTATQDVSFPDEEFRAKQPTAGSPRPFNLPGIVQFKLGDQIDVYLAERHELPTISMELNFDGGSFTDTASREGMASVCMSMMSEGTKRLDKLAFEEALADLASNVSSRAGAESQAVSMSTLSKNFDATFALFTETLLEPGFRKEELDRMVQRRLESLKQAKGSARSVAGRLDGSIYYGPKHPFGRVTTEKSLSKIKIADCVRHHRSYVKPKGARLFVVGDMTKEQIVAKFEPLLTKWKGAPRALAKMPKPRSRYGKIFFVDIPGSAQSSIYVMHKGPDRKAPEFFQNQMMAMVLGGGFSSRLNMNLREDKGYSYGARGGFSYNKFFGRFTASSSVRSDATYQSILEVLREIKELKEGKTPAKEEELNREKNGAILGLPARFATARQVLGMYRSLVYYDLPMTYYNDYVDNVTKVSLDQVKEAAAKLLTPEDVLILVVGDSKAAQNIRDDSGKDVPMKSSDGKPVALHDALLELAASPTGGKGKLIKLDPDGNPLR
jgi:predicted Zn-dependent peptidase